MNEHEQDHCHNLLASLSEYVDGALSDALCADLEEHMRRCNKCRVVVDTLKKTVELYHQEAEDEEMPQQVRERLFLKLNLEDYLKPEHKD